jgi:hypothetical protein
MKLCFVMIALIGCCIGFAGGCKHNQADQAQHRSIDAQHLASIPASANKVAEGHTALKYTAESGGLLYLYDENTHRVIDAQRINKGQTYRVSAPRGMAWVDNQPVLLGPVNEEHLLRIYLDPQ